jgi:MarR family
VESWSFLTNHARVLLCIARDPGVRLRDLAASLGITERSAHSIVADLAAAGYVVKHKQGRRNRYQIQAHLPLPETASQEPAIGDVLAVLVADGARQEPIGADGGDGVLPHRPDAVSEDPPPGERLDRRAAVAELD